LGKGRFMAKTTQVSTLFSYQPTQLMLGFMAAIGLMVSVAHSASAQQAADVPQPQQIFQDQQNRDPFSGRGSDQAGGVMDLVHRAMQAGSLSNEDFYNQQTENLDSAAADFRAAQQQRLNGTPANKPATTAGTAPQTK
jgi:hypothetical protein